MLLFSNEEYHSSSRRYFSRTCNYTNLGMIKLIKVFNTTQTKFQWSGQIIKKDVYYPLILICSQNYSNLSIEYQYVNGKTLIDYRNEHKSKIFLFFTIVNLILGTIWLVNTYYKSNFIIPLQQMMSFLPLIKAISDSLISIEWERRKYEDEITKLKRINDVISSFFHILFLIVLSLAFSGFCIYRNKLPIIDVFQILFSALAIVSADVFVENSKYSFNFFILKIIGEFWYLKMNVKYLMISCEISETFFHDENMKMKVKMVHNFIFSFLLFLLLFFLIKFFSKYVGLFEMIDDTISEFGITFCEAIEIVFFMLRDDFCDHNEIKQFFFLKEPKRTQYIFLFQEK